MSITTYAELRAAVARWMTRTDQASNIPDFIALAEGAINRRLRLRQQEAVLAPAEIVGGAVALPAGALAVKALWPAGRPAAALRPQTLEFVASRGAQGIPTHYAWEAAQWRFDGAGSVQGVYFVRVPALSDAAPVNWLLTAAPDLYLFGALAEAMLFVKDEQRAAMWRGRFDAVLAELEAADQRDRFSGGPLVARAR